MDQLKKNINNSIKKLIDALKVAKRGLQQNTDDRLFEPIMASIKYIENYTRFYRTSLMLIEAVEQNKPDSAFESIIKKRMEYMSIAMELLPYLVEHGVTQEHRYLQICKDFKEEYQFLHEHE